MRRWACVVRRLLALQSNNSLFGAFSVGTYEIIGPARNGWNLSWSITMVNLNLGAVSSQSTFRLTLSSPALAEPLPMTHLALTVWRHPLNVYLAQRNVKAFNKHSWEEIPGKERPKLWQDLLHGLCAIHQRDHQSWQPS